MRHATQLGLVALALSCSSGPPEPPPVPKARSGSNAAGGGAVPDGDTVAPGGPGGDGSVPGGLTPGGPAMMPSPGVSNPPVSGPTGATSPQPVVGPSGDPTVPAGGAGSMPGGPIDPLPVGGAPSNLPAEEPTVIYDVNALPGSVLQVGIEIGDAERESLEANPWTAEDVMGTFIDANGTRYENIELNYRGAYQLINLMMIGDGRRRNWKVKVTDDQKYLGHREWNFNSEQHVRHKLAYDLMAFAGVPAPPATHVEFRVNGESQGLYLQFADPDNKSHLKDHFGSAAGDLFKAAHDLPNEEAYFAPLEYWGTNVEDYLLHYNKKLNNNGGAATDFTNLITFLQGLNETPDEEMPSWFGQHFDTERFISYLVVANFMSHWDSYPYRPKNYWLYQSPVTTRWVYLPWDLDHTFETHQEPLMPMGSYVGIFFDLDYAEGPENPGEGRERPLVRRLVAIPELRQRYIDRYKELMGGILARDYLENRIRALDSLVRPFCQGEDQELLDEATEDMLQFVAEKHEHVKSELDSL